MDHFNTPPVQPVRHCSDVTPKCLADSLPSHRIYGARRTHTPEFTTRTLWLKHINFDGLLCINYRSLSVQKDSGHSFLILLRCESCNGGYFSTLLPAHHKAPQILCFGLGGLSVRCRDRMEQCRLIILLFSIIQNICNIVTAPTFFCIMWR